MSFQRKVSEADATESKLAQVGTAATATATAIVHARGEDVQIQTFGLCFLDRLLAAVSVLFLYPLPGVFESAFQLVRLIH